MEDYESFWHELPQVGCPAVLSYQNPWAFLQGIQLANNTDLTHLIDYKQKSLGFSERECSDECH